MNKRQAKKFRRNLEGTVNLVESLCNRWENPGEFIVAVANDLGVHEISRKLKCTKSQAYMFQQVCKSCGVVVEKSWDCSIYDWVLFPRPERVVYNWGRRKYPDGFLNLDNSDPEDWEKTTMSMSVRKGEYKNYINNVELY